MGDQSPKKHSSPIKSGNLFGSMRDVLSRTDCPPVHLMPETKLNATTDSAGCQN